MSDGPVGRYRRKVLPFEPGAGASEAEPLAAALNQHMPGNGTVAEAKRAVAGIPRHLSVHSRLVQEVRPAVS